MFRIKICGLTSAEDARQAAAAGADALGLNFYAGSPRCVSLPQARQIVEAVPGDVQKIGVFVNSSVEQIRITCDQLRLDAIQLHGDEPPGMLAELSGMRVIRAFRCKDGDLQPLLDYLSQCQRQGCLPDGLLIDAWQADHYGGTGQAADWPTVRKLSTLTGGLQIALAGGLTADNVEAAIAVAHPAAVDTASGVESAPGQKDAARMRAFVAAANAGFAAVEW